MGNCMETRGQKQQQQEEEGHQMQEMKNKKKGHEIKFEKEEKDVKLRVKIVLTKQELQLLMLELQDKGGKKSLEQVLEDVKQKGRGGKLVMVDETWKPSLDSIMECPEHIQDMNRKIVH